VIYVARPEPPLAVRSYSAGGGAGRAKTGSLMREAVDLEYILVGNESEALALEPTSSRSASRASTSCSRTTRAIPTSSSHWPTAILKFVTRRLLRMARPTTPLFPGSLAGRVVELIHRSFQLPVARSISPATIPARVSSTTFIAAWPLRGGPHHARSLQEGCPRCAAPSWKAATPNWRTR